MNATSRTLASALIGMIALLAHSNEAFASRQAVSAVIAVLPFESRVEGADVRNLRADTVKVLAAKGWTIAPDDAVEAVLEESRVRFMDSADAELRGHLAERLGVTAIVFGTIYTYQGGDNPIVALSVRMVDVDGHLVWGDVAGVSAGDTERVMGLGRTDDPSRLAQIVVKRVMDGAPHPGSGIRVSRGPSHSLFKRSPRSFESKGLAKAAPARVCVLPIDSVSEDSAATRIVSDILALRLAAAGMNLVEAADFRAAMRAEKLRSFRGITPSQLEALGKRLDAALFVRGSIYDFREAPATSANVPPNIDVELSMLNIADGKVVWSSMSERSALDYRGLLMLGAPSNAVTLSNRVISEMVASIRVNKKGTLSKDDKSAEIKQ